ncbi:MAG: endopeptidase La [Eubacteriales bacterium]|nr:endopeptidase La [Eubacteriales bacterium]
MISIPIYDVLILPGVTFYFKKDMFPGSTLTADHVGEDVLFLLLKSDKRADQILPEDIYPIGIQGKIESFSEDGNVKINAKDRVSIRDIQATEQGITANTSLFPELADLPEEEEKERFQELKKDLLNFARGFQWELWARGMIYHWKSFDEVACAMGGYLSSSWEEKYALLEMSSRRERCARIQEIIYELMEIFRVGEEAESAQKDSNEQMYRESALKKQIDFLQRQLDEMHPENISDVRRFEKKLQEAGMNEEAQKEAEKVLNRMKQEGKDSHEYGMLYDYLDFVTTLSWKSEEMPDIDLRRAEEILNEDHYGLKKVKERIIQQIAVMALNKKQSGSILLFVGAPGTGKTSIGQSIAKALQRKYVRISLGGVRDEAEIRGHRRTYVGAMPGRIMEGMKRSGAQNPVMVLDEVDKLAKDYGGDPASALLEVLDPEQNHTFTDHYMNVPYDLSNVFFVCTANSTDTIPEPLLNRMEIIQFPGYTAVEKFHIAKKHLLPKAMKAMGIKKQQLKVADEAIRRTIGEYTAESGVRGLKRQMDVLCRHAAVKLVKGEKKSVTVSEKRLEEFLGNKGLRRERLMEKPTPGVVTGLAWTMAGGEILFIETMFTKGKGKTIITGQLGDVMKESAQIAVTLVKSMYPEKASLFEENDLHIHVPSGAVPKDGPSAGITLVTALSSLVTGRGVDPQVAMTGEISLRGGVMPIGGLPEKLMAAQRAGVTRVFIPADNEEDLKDVAAEVKEKLTILPVREAAEVLAAVLPDEE